MDTVRSGLGERQVVRVRRVSTPAVVLLLLVVGVLSTTPPVLGVGGRAVAGESGADGLDGQGSATSATGAPLYVPVTPFRVLDTRHRVIPLQHRQTVTTAVGGVGEIPTDALAVAINITAVTPTREGYLTVWPAGQPRPDVSSINFRARAVVGNFVIAELGTDGRLAIYNHNGQTDVVFDVVGYLPAGSRYTPVTPTRVLDTRNDVQGDLMAPVGPRSTVTTSVGGVGGVPADALAVAINITAVHSTRDGYLTVWPEGQPRPVVSSINFPARRVVGNFVLAELGTDGKVAIYNHNGLVDVVFDVVGYLPASSFYVPVTPTRVLDTRDDVHGDLSGWLLPGATVTTTVGGVGGVPADALAVAINITAVNPGRSGYVTVWPDGQSRPYVSSINFPAGAIVGNFVLAELGANGKLAIYNHTSTVDVVFDVVGFLPAGGRSEITAGHWHNCARRGDGTISCWGHNGRGQLGDGTDSNVRSTLIDVAHITDATQISAGQYHTCARHVDATVSCWGENYWGQLGDGTTTDRTTPVKVAGIHDVVHVSAGSRHTCALHGDGTASCWGIGISGQLGDGYRRDHLTPFKVSGITDATQITAGSAHTCALHADGTASCWGGNSYGQLGDGTHTERLTPVTVIGINDATQLTVGDHHTCARHADATVSCWGENGRGQLGDGTTTDRTTPVEVAGINDAAHLSAGIRATCTGHADGTASCWGANIAGKLGDGTTTDRTSPVEVAGINDASEIAAGYLHTCARHADGSASCWGEMVFGQLGDGTDCGTSLPDGPDFGGPPGCPFYPPIQPYPVSVHGLP